MRAFVLIIGTMMLGFSAAAAGIDSRTYTCDNLHALIAARGFVFISQATFGDFVVSNVSYCADSSGAGMIQRRSVATSDQPECPINYCVIRSYSGS